MSHVREPVDQLDDVRPHLGVRGEHPADGVVDVGGEGRVWREAELVALHGEGQAVTALGNRVEGGGVEAQGVEKAAERLEEG